MGYTHCERDRKIRIATHHLTGERRVKAIELYASSPEELTKALHRRFIRTKKIVNFTIRLSGSDYLKLMDMAGEAGSTMAAYARRKLGL
jgi:hypothetical protein